MCDVVIFVSQICVKFVLGRKWGEACLAERWRFWCPCLQAMFLHRNTSSGNCFWTAGVNRTEGWCATYVWAYRVVTLRAFSLRLRWENPGWKPFMAIFFKPETMENVLAKPTAVCCSAPPSCVCFICFLKRCFFFLLKVIYGTMTMCVWNGYCRWKFTILAPPSRPSRPSPESKPTGVAGLGMLNEHKHSAVLYTNNTSRCSLVQHIFKLEN